MHGLIFTSPIALLAFFLLPLFYWLMQIKPPTPLKVTFPAFNLLKSLVTQEETPKGIPLWMLLFRLLILTCLILGFAGPTLFPDQNIEAKKHLYIIDDGWSSAPIWKKIKKESMTQLQHAKKSDSLVKLVFTASTPHQTEWLSPGDAHKVINSHRPSPWPTQRVEAILEKPGFEKGKETGVFWFSNGLASPGDPALLKILKRKSSQAFLRLYKPLERETAHALLPPERTQTGFSVEVIRPYSQNKTLYSLIAKDTNGHSLAQKELILESGKSKGIMHFSLPSRLSNQLVAIQSLSSSSAGATVLVDTSWKRPSVGLVLPSEGYETRPFLSDLYYIRKALKPFTELKEATLSELLKKKPDSLIMIDEARSDRKELREYVESGGFLIRFSGPKLAASPDSLTPTNLRTGERLTGGRLNWKTPQKIESFKENTPYYGLNISEDIFIRQQILAEPSPELSQKVWASLEDGSPLVTSAPLGKGRIVLFHIRPHPDWSDLPVTGLFVDMLKRTLAQIHNHTSIQDRKGLYLPYKMLNFSGNLTLPLANIEAIRLEKGNKLPPVNSKRPPGLYQGAQGQIALNIMQKNSQLLPLRLTDLSLTLHSYGKVKNINLGTGFLLGAFLFLILDSLILFFLSGRGAKIFKYKKSFLKVSAFLFLIPVLLQFHMGYCQTKSGENLFLKNKENLLSLRFAYVKTSHEEIDQHSKQGLQSLVQTLSNRTSIEAKEPVGLDIYLDNLKPFPIIYWPITSDTPELPPKTAQKISAYLINGGLIVFDTQNAGSPSQTLSTQKALRRLLKNVDIPKLQKLPKNHVLKRSFYLLETLPGRYNTGDVWVEADTNATRDGVSSILIGSNDWASSWVLDQKGHAVIPSEYGDGTNEMALRFGVNLIMYALMGNYKTDQVHAAAIIRRQGKKK